MDRNIEEITRQLISKLEKNPVKEIEVFRKTALIDFETKGLSTNYSIDYINLICDLVIFQNLEKARV